MKLIIKKILPKKILARLIIIFFVPLICIQVLTILLFYDRHWDKITTRFVNIASNQVNLIMESYTDNKFLDQKLSQALNLKTRIVTDKVQYKDKANNCFKFISKEASCIGNVKTIPIQNSCQVISSANINTDLSYNSANQLASNKGKFTKNEMVNVLKRLRETIQ